MSLSTPIVGRPIRLRKRTKAESNGRFVLYIAAGCIVLAIFQSVETLLFLRGAETVEGKILIVNSFYRHDKTGEYLAYRPIIRFKSLDGDEHDTDDVTESRVPPPIGAKVTVHYHRGHRRPSRLDAELWTAPFALSCVGTLLAAFGATLIGGGRILPKLGIPLKLCK